MDSSSPCSELETNLMPNRKVIKLVLQLKSGKNYIKVKAHLVRHLLNNRIQQLSKNLETALFSKSGWWCLPCQKVRFSFKTGFHCKLKTFLYKRHLCQTVAYFAFLGRLAAQDCFLLVQKWAYFAIHTTALFVRKVGLIWLPGDLLSRLS